MKKSLVYREPVKLFNAPERGKYYTEGPILNLSSISAPVFFKNTSNTPLLATVTVIGTT
jgi:hypothetical protein